MKGFLVERGFRERERAAIVALLREYEAGLGVSLCFQGFAAEIAGLPGDYAPPRGEMLLARDQRNGELVGIVAVRPARHDAGRCEMKRLYVRPSTRGAGAGRALALAAIGEAQRLGYRRMCLDTLPAMTGAQALYRSLGFLQTGTSDTQPAVLLFERELRPS